MPIQVKIDWLPEALVAYDSRAINAIVGTGAPPPVTLVTLPVPDNFGGLYLVEWHFCSGQAVTFGGITEYDLIWSSTGGPDPIFLDQGMLSEAMDTRGRQLVDVPRIPNDATSAFTARVQSVLPISVIMRAWIAFEYLGTRS